MEEQITKFKKNYTCGIPFADIIRFSHFSAGTAQLI